MNSRDTIITAAEVVKFAPLDKNSAAQYYCEFIVNKEEKLFRECLGFDFYLALLADKIDYTGTPTFKQATNYSVGDVVLFGDTYFKCIQATTGTQTPNDKTFFEYAPKFNNADNEFIWVRYLRTLIAYSVAYTSIIHRTVQHTDQGIVRKKGDTFEPVPIAQAFQVKKEYEGDIKDIFDNMDAYIIRNPGKYPTYWRIQTQCDSIDKCNQRKPRNRGWLL